MLDTPQLDWLALTKRPENFLSMVPPEWLKHWPPNVWAGTTVGCAATRWRAEMLAMVPAPLRFLSVEPIAEYFDLAPVLEAGLIHHVILGAESGHHATPCDVDWIREMVATSRRFGCSVFVKQLGAVPVADTPTEWPAGTQFGNRTKDQQLDGRVPLLKAYAGVDPEEWPMDLRIQEDWPRWRLAA